MLADRREVVSRRIEYMLPSGTNGAEVAKTLNVAETEYRQMHGLQTSPGSGLGYIHVEADGDGIVIVFVVEKESS